MTDGIRAVFEQAGCEGTLCVQSLDDDAEVVLRADEPVVPASVVKVAAKSGSLLGMIRNEIGVISYPDGRRYAAAVFTRSRPGSDDFAIGYAIGTATAHAVTALRADRT